MYECSTGWPGVHGASPDSAPLALGLSFPAFKVLPYYIFFACICMYLGRLFASASGTW